jgi:sulfite exporter TauE/SafE
VSVSWPTLAAVFGASVIGSLHCVGMCGGFVAVISGAGAERSGAAFGSRLAPLLAYQLSRGLAYLGLGVLAGLLGAGLDASAALVGVHRLAGPLMGLTLIAIAVATLWPSRREPTPLVRLGLSAPTPGLLARLRTRLSEAVRERGSRAGAAAGLLSALLPCGWLWAYVVVAASTGSVGHAVLVMAAFWLGSMPALLGVGVLAGELGRRLGRHAPRISAAIMLTLGALSLAGKLGPSLPATAPAGEHAAEQAPEHTGEAQPALPDSAPCH